MILLTRLNGTQVGINADLIERVEASGDTVVSLIDGTRYVVSESCADVVDRVIDFRARVLIAADAGLDGRLLDGRVVDGRVVDGVQADDRERPNGRTGTGPLRLVVEHDAELADAAAQNPDDFVGRPDRSHDDTAADTRARNRRR